MPKPTLKSFSQDLYDRVQPLNFADPTYDYPIAKLAQAFGMMFQVVEDYGRDDPITGQPGWSVVMDISKCPNEALPWLGQFVGVRLPTGLTPDQQRAYIKDAPGWDRGTVAALKAAVSPYLAGNKSVIVRERFNQANPNVDSPGYFQVTTYANETPIDLENAPSTLSVNNGEITDAVRAANVSGDGRAAPDSSFGIWEAATNLHPNGSFDTNTIGYAGYVGSIARITTDSKFGTSCLECTTVAGGGGCGAQSVGVVTGAPLTSGSYTLSAWVKGV